MLEWSDWSIVMSSDMKMVRVFMMIIFSRMDNLFVVIWKRIKHMMESWSV